MAQNWKRLLVFCFYCNTVTAQISDFSNPILDGPSIRDAAIVKTSNFYYLSYPDYVDNEIRILKSQYLTDFRNAEKGTVYRIPPGFTSFPPSSFLQYKNNLYLYFHMRTESTTPYHVFVAKSQDAENPLGAWSAPVRVLDHIWNKTAFHGATFVMNNQLYFVWNSPSDSNPTWSLHVARMHSPTEVYEPVVLLQEDGECSLEAPSFLYNRDKVYMVLTSCSPDNLEQSLTYLSIQIDLDPMNSANWVAAPGPMFQGNAEENVYHPRFSEFTTSPDGTETWMLYTAFSNASDVNPSNCVRIEKIEWDKIDGSPKFPVARANGYQQQIPSREPSKFLNPILDNIYTDPIVLQDGSTYYMVLANKTELFVLRSDTLFDFRNSEKALIYVAPENINGLSATCIIEISGEVYIYFYAWDTNSEYRTYVLKSQNRSDLMHDWGTPTKLLDGVYEEKAIQGTILEFNENIYYVWASSDINNASTSVLYIAPMLTPTEVIAPAVLLKQPREPWECHLRCINDYPSFVYSKTAAYLVFSASSDAAPESSLSYIRIEFDRDPMDVTSWYTAPGPVFERNDAESIFAPSHASFTSSPDGSETWMLYEAADNITNIQGSQRIRLEKIDWNNKTGEPVFPYAHGFNNPQPIPRQFEYFANPVEDESLKSPSVICIGNFYYMALSTTSGLEILKSGKLTDFRNVEKQVIFSVPDTSTILGSAKLHLFNEELYIYFSMQNENATSKNYVLQAKDPMNPMGIWTTSPTLLSPTLDFPAFHGTILIHASIYYLVWVTPHSATGFNSIFIAKMENATSVVEPFVLIRHPIELWECDGGCSNEAPFAIYNNRTTFLVHSVGSACKDGDALTYMSIAMDKDPLNILHWNKAPGKVFSEHQDNSVFCPAHATFTMSPDQKQTWMVYHATDSPHPDAIKTSRIEKITWDHETGKPIFPEPHGLYHQQLAPSNE